MHVVLRQACLVVPDLAPVVRLVGEVFGTQATHGSADGSNTMNPEGREFLSRQAGVANVTLPLGRDFLELIAPLRADTAAARHLARRGVGGYMLILQAGDIPSWRAHMDAAGVRIVRSIDHHQYEAFHVHPSDIGGAIVSLGATRPVNEPAGPWYPAAWVPDRAPATLVDGWCSATLEARDPDAMRARWRDVLRLPQDDDGTLAMDNASLRFVAAGDRGEGIRRLTLATHHAPDIQRRARAAGVLDADGAVRIAGVTFDLAPPDRTP